MNINPTREEELDSCASVQPEKTSLVAGPGIVIKGDIVSEIEDPDNRILVVGRVQGDIYTKGILQIAKGAVVAGNCLIQADTIIVSGSIIGENLIVKARLLVLQGTANVTVAAVRLPCGGLEQHRGSVLDARLTMADEVMDSKDALPNVDHNAQQANQLTALLDATSLELSSLSGASTQPWLQANSQFAAAA